MPGAWLALGASRWLHCHWPIQADTVFLNPCLKLFQHGGPTYYTGSTTDFVRCRILKVLLTYFEGTTSRKFIFNMKIRCLPREVLELKFGVV